MTGAVMDVLLMVQPDPDVDVEQVERITRQLRRRELADLPLDAIRHLDDGEVPESAKAADPVTVGAIVVAMGASGGVFNAVIEAVRDLLARHSARHRIAITIDGDTIELGRSTSTQRDDLVQAFVNSHTVP